MYNARRKNAAHWSSSGFIESTPLSNQSVSTQRTKAQRTEQTFLCIPYCTRIVWRSTGEFALRKPTSSVYSPAGNGRPVCD